MLDFLLPSAPSNWTEDVDYKVISAISKPTLKKVEAIGKPFNDLARRHRLGRTIKNDKELTNALASIDAEAEGDDGNDDWYDPTETKSLLKSDPLKWKSQDHYAVLGLGKRRWLATDAQIKTAYRKKVLVHHPDKKSSADLGKLNNDSFFKCIQRAWEVLTDPEARRRFDSVDPTFDDSIPSVKAKGDFFEIYGKVFSDNARFSTKTPVPSIGNLETSREDVEDFYAFWYAFDSWRSFENLDEESTSSMDSREEKRWTDRKNKAARSKRKKEDNVRITKLIDQAFKLDPRIIMFKQKEKDAKLAKKMEKENAAQAIIDAQKKEEEAIEAAKQKVLDEAKSIKEAAKKEKEALKKVIKKERKTIKKALEINSEENFADIEIEKQLEETFELLDVPGLESLRTQLENFTGDLDKIRFVFQEYYTKMKASQASGKPINVVVEVKKEVKQAEKKWTPKEVSTLTKAIKMFPGGTLDRWGKIAEYVNDHGDNAASPKNAGDCIKTSKQVQQGASSNDREALQKTTNKKKPELNDQPTLRTEDTVPELKVDPRVWSNEQQGQLEAALKKYPAPDFANDPSERWVKIEEEVNGKTLKDIKARMKELRNVVKKKNSVLNVKK